MSLVLLLKAMGLGLAVAAPLGPIGALCITRTLERGFAAGLAGGLGTALADASYAAMAAAGFAAFASVLGLVDLPLRVLGGAFMLWLAWKGLHAGPPRRAAQIGARDLAGTVAATFLLTMANPSTILSFAALFAGLGLAAETSLAEAALVTAGVFAGSMLWWCLLSGGVALCRHRLPQGFATWVSRLSALMLAGFGLWALASALRLMMG
ncbi:putative LysE/RhtB family amino acid efflux pump [Pseudooceanicola antarcticus]|uniref:Lysine transporter LysE n=1 Tax=Pseudooceanicola antarcticus TaxID=1247613 RepID=A0A285HWR7_9RHOB|nr:LysE family transporter [Pseudooceanicola antarcticus]PJE27527.1 lysine transporter LysE [Pseudooceanicola antarcticus]SNY39151.1 putative LysE/RhtB family amino acid efflux pump [Pseudooceanicola antarcticus]